MGKPILGACTGLIVIVYVFYVIRFYIILKALFNKTHWDLSNRMHIAYKTIKSIIN